MSTKALGLLSTLVGLVLAGGATRSDAQIVTGPPNPQQQQPLVMPLNNGNPQLTPDQQKQLMMTRALQGRSRRGVQTGVPQFIPFGSPMVGPMAMPMSDVQASDGGDAKKSGNQKTAEERKRLQQERKDKEKEKRDKVKKDKDDAAKKKADAAKKAKDKKTPEKKS